MFHVVLYQPEIAPNTGNIIRLCANTGLSLHLIKPLGFELDDRRLKRAGLDYAEWQRIHEHDSLRAFVQTQNPERLLAFTTKGRQGYADITYERGDALLFGPETRGLPEKVLESASKRIRIPMHPGSRSLNLSNAVAVACYEAWRQHGFESGLTPGTDLV